MIEPGAGERARELAALIEEHMPLESAAGEPGDCGCSCMERFTTEYTWKGYCEHLARKLAVALAAVRLEEARWWHTLMDENDAEIRRQSMLQP